MKYQVIYKAYLGYEEKELTMQIKASSKEQAKKKAEKQINKLNSQHRGFYEVVNVI